MIKSTKIVRSVTGEKIKFEGELIMNATFNAKTLELKSFVQKNTNNLFDTISALGLADQFLQSENRKLEYRSWKTKKRAKGSRYKFFFWWFKEVYQNNGKIWTSRQRLPSVQKEAKCALCLVGTT